MDIVRDNIDFSVYEHRDEWHAVKPASAWLEELLERMQKPLEHVGDALPWAKADGYRMRRSEVSVWAGVNGHGKSMVLSQVMLNVMPTGKRVLLASMEMPPVKSMERMLRQASCCANPGMNYARKFHAWTDDRLWIYDKLGMVQPKKMLAVIRYARDKFAVDHVVVDSLMKCGVGPDDYAGQKAFVDGLCAIALETGVHIHLVAHARKGEKETDKMDKFDIKGTSEIADQVDNIILVQRNKKKESNREGKYQDEPDAFLTIAKQRHGEWEGTIGLWFDKNSQSFIPYENSSPAGIDL